MLVLLVLTDFAFLLLFALRAVGVVTDDGFILTYDHSYAEYFQYLKFIVLVVMLLGLAIQQRALLYLALATMFALFLVDDYAMLHETWGEQIAEYLGIPQMWMLQPYDFGEFIVFIGYGIIVGALLAVGWWTARASQMRYLREMIGLVILLAAFAVGLDVLHALALPELISNSIGALEDGGEMFVVSLMVWRTLLFTRRKAKAAGVGALARKPAAGVAGSGAPGYSASKAVD